MGENTHYFIELILLELPEGRRVVQHFLHVVEALVEFEVQLVLLKLRLGQHLQGLAVGGLKVGSVVYLLLEDHLARVEGAQVFPEGPKNRLDVPLFLVAFCHLATILLLLLEVLALFF